MYQQSILPEDTMNLHQQLFSEHTPEDHLDIFWLGQAGFFFRTDAGLSLAVDPYLTDCGERIKNYKGFKRLTPKLIQPKDFCPRYVLSTHHHFDHLDYDAIPDIAAQGTSEFLAPESCCTLMHDEMGIDSQRLTALSPGDELHLDRDLTLYVFDADHGAMAPEAIGLGIEYRGLRIYISGDTGFSPEIFRTVHKFQPHVGILSVNGAFGNLTGTEGGQLAGLLNLSLAIPCHFGTFAEHGGDPASFISSVKEHAPTCTPFLMAQGERLRLNAYDYSDSQEQERL
ncbi:MBL fold metallo-hydrolase [Desulfobaculum bizertense]|nr:MBL fold metallo-hydrolase [Desulfobaculum bizertense]